MFVVARPGLVVTLFILCQFFQHLFNPCKQQIYHPRVHHLALFLPYFHCHGTDINNKKNNFQIVTTNPGPGQVVTQTGVGCNTFHNLVSTPDLEGRARMCGCVWHQEEQWRSPKGFDPLKYYIWKNNWQYRKHHAPHQIRLQNQMKKTYANNRNLFRYISRSNSDAKSMYYI